MIMGTEGGTKMVTVRTRLTDAERLDLRLARVRRGLTQFQVAKALGLHELYISVYECGRSEPPEEVLARWKVLLGLDGAGTL